jgi:predicted ATPase/DNA-binding XRE family transcriptional regulator
MDMDDGRAFGGLLKRHRRATHLTQEELAERAGYSFHYISMLERGVRLPQPQTIAVLAEALALDEAARQMLLAAAMPSEPAATRWQHLAAPARSLIGREQEWADVTNMLRDEGVRALTLTGPGGVGKTSLAHAAAAALAPDFADGAVFIDFSVVSDSDEILPTIARALHLRDIGSRTVRDRLAGFLRERKMLLLLDSFERVVDGAEAVGELLLTCRGVKCLVTSRAPLRLRMEHEYRVQPLTLPRFSRAESPDDLMRYAAVALFVHHARMLRRDFVIDDANASVIVDIARRLDGLPLAIELAASRLAYLPLATLRDRLQRRLHILTGGDRDLPARQQQMRNAIAWSYDLLPPGEQSLLRQLAVFAGSWTLEAAEDVCDGKAAADGVLDGLGTLAEHSLIIPLEPITDEPRYRMLDTIREFGVEQAAAKGELAVLHRRHALYYVLLAEQAEPALQDRNQAVWYPLLEREHDNIRAALGWMLDADEAELALRLAGAVWRFWHRHGDIREGRRWLEDGLARGQHVSKPVRAKALWGASWLAYHHGDYARGSALSTEQLALARELDDALSIRNALTGIGVATLAEGRSEDAMRAFQEALDVCAPLGNIWHHATSCLNLGAATLVAGHLDRATALFEEAVRLYQERGDAVFVARARQHLGYISLRQGDFARAETIFAESLHALAALDEKSGVADGLEAVAATRAATGHTHQAGVLIGAADSLREQIGVAALPYIRLVWQPFVADAESLLGAQLWLEAQTEGGALALAEAVARAVVGAV